MTKSLDCGKRSQARTRKRKNQEHPLRARSGFLVPNQVVTLSYKPKLAKGSKPTLIGPMEGLKLTKISDSELRIENQTGGLAPYVVLILSEKAANLAKLPWPQLIEQAKGVPAFVRQFLGHKGKL